MPRGDSSTFGPEIYQIFLSELSKKELKQEFVRGYWIFYQNVKFFDKCQPVWVFYQKIKIVMYFQNMYYREKVGGTISLNSHVSFSKNV